jgi:hypothetical protein
MAMGVLGLEAQQAEACPFRLGSELFQRLLLAAEVLRELPEERTEISSAARLVAECSG